MTATLKFTLPEESAEHKMAIHGPRYAAALQTLDAHLRGCLKHGHEYKSADDAIEAIRLLLLSETENLDLWL